MTKMFISYSSKDKIFAKKLCNDLIYHGIDVWLDERKIQIGDDIRRKIDQGISDYEYFGIILSSSSVSSEWVQRELSAAYNKEMSSDRVVILPIRIEHCQIPPLISGKKYADFSQDYMEGLNSLLDTFKVSKIRDWKLKNIFPSIHINVISARRGKLEPPQRVIAGFYSSASKEGHTRDWAFSFILEGVGENDDDAILVTNTCNQVITDFIKKKVENAEELNVEEIFKEVALLTDFSIKFVNGKTGKIVGAKMSLVLQIGNQVYATRIGDCLIITCHKEENGDLVIKRISPSWKVYTSLEGPSFNVTRAPLGQFVLDEEGKSDLELEIISSNFGQSGDLIAFTSFSFPSENEVYANVAKLIEENKSEYVAKYLCEIMPDYKDYMAMTIIAQ